MISLFADINVISSLNQDAGYFINETGMTLTLRELLETIYWWTQHYLRNKFHWELGISKYQLQIFCFHDTVYNEGISLSNSDHCSDQVAHPARVYKVQMIQAPQLVIVMKENPILVKESGGWSGKERKTVSFITAMHNKYTRQDWICVRF